jgi:parallel beta-helix repeat protein
MIKRGYPNYPNGFSNNYPILNNRFNGNQPKVQPKENTGISKSTKVLLILAIFLMSVGLIFLLIRGIIHHNPVDNPIQKFNADLKISKVEMLNYTDISIKLDRNESEENIEAIVFIFYDSDDSEITRRRISIEKLEIINFQIVFHFTNISKISKVSVIPIFKSESGEEINGSIEDEYEIRIESGNESIQENVTIPCTLDSGCEDNNSCTANICSGGNCFYSLIEGCVSCEFSYECEDSNECTANSCSEGRCNYLQIPGCMPCYSATQCNDDNSCTDNLCFQGKCLYNVIENCTSHNNTTNTTFQCTSYSQCEDNNACTINNCSNNKCVYSSINNCIQCTSSSQCIDNNACTTDACFREACLYTSIASCVNNDGCCPTGKGCTYLNDNDCIQCTSTAQCSDNNACTTDSCLNGVCSYPPISGCCISTLQCNDTKICTIDRCSSNQCSNSLISSCISNDGCCPAGIGCTSITDNDCAAVCGNSVKEGTEVCDGTSLGGASCSSVLGAGYTGNLRCSNCMFNTSLCVAPCTQTCTSLNYQCGTRIVCGNSINCGTCPTDYACKANGTCIKNIVCTDTCSSLAYQCGIQTICGSAVVCGNCPTGYNCNSNGLCVQGCTDTCSSLAYQCGTHTVCGSSVNCGSCSTGYTCTNGVCTSNSPNWQTGLVAWWKFNGNLLDSIGTHSMTNNGATFQTTGCVSGQCVLFDGTSDYVQVTHTSDLNPGSDLTMAGWVYWDGTNGEQNVLTKEGAYEFRVNSGYVNYATNPWEWRGGSSALINPTAWAHVVVTHDGDGQQKIYINGINKYSTSSGGGIVNNDNPLTIGGRLSAVAYFDGAIDEVMIWNRVLDASEVQELFNSFGYTPPTCTNDCTSSGAKQCSGNGYQTCGNYDSDSCLEWSSVTACSTGQTCSGGICQSTAATCSDGIQNQGETGVDCGGPCPACSSYSRTFYISSSTGSDSNTGTSSSSPWKTLSKVNSQTFMAGDGILFKRGDVWYGSLTISASGSSSAPITYGAYGSGEKPIISGFTTVSGWTSYGGGTYYKSVSTQSSPLIVTIDGVNTPKGRWPNTGWLLYDSFSGNTEITDSDLNGRNFDSGEVVIRVARWITYRAPISSHSGSTINFPWTLSYSLNSGQGYFIQNDVDTFDIFGDWAYVNGNLYMYFGSNSPTNYAVKIPTIDELVYLNNKDYITFDNLKFEGANVNALQVRNSRHISIDNCIFQDLGGNGIYGPWDGDSSYMKVENCEFIDDNNCGIKVQGDHEYATIRYNTLQNIGMIDGLADVVDGSAIGIHVIGSNALISYNKLDYIGYNGIHFGVENGAYNSKVSNNFVNHFCQKKDDGAGIYTYEDGATGKQITNNIVLNGMSHAEGIGGYIPDGSHENIYHEHDNAHGIYIDGSDNILISGNTVANNEGSGIFINTQALNMNIQDNTVFNNVYGIEIISNMHGGGEITGMNMQNNIFTAKESDQRTLYYATASGDSAVRQLGTVNNNYYARPIDDTDSFRTQINAWNGPTTYRTLAGWQSYSGYDTNSHKSPKSVSSTSDLRFEYNPTGSTKTVTLSGNYIDIKGTAYSGSVTLQPYSSVILIKN